MRGPYLHIVVLTATLTPPRQVPALTCAYRRIPVVPSRWYDNAWFWLGPKFTLNTCHILPFAFS